MKTYKLICIAFFCVALFASCKKDVKPSEVSLKNIQAMLESMKGEQFALQVINSEDKKFLATYYDLEHIKEYYSWQNLTYSPPQMVKIPGDLKSISYDSLRILKYEVFARNGFLFSDGFLRGYFESCNWYMPVFGVDTFKLLLNKKEIELVNKIIDEEKSRKKNIVIASNGLNLYNADLIVNNKHFFDFENVIQNDFKKQNFSIVSAKHPMPFYVYDENAYAYIPHYITTDLYLFILHKYFSSFIQKLDDKFLSKELKSILTNVSKKLKMLSKDKANSNFKSTFEWTEMFNTLAMYAMGEKQANSQFNNKSVFQLEKTNIDNQEGEPIFIPNELANYQNLKPRGHYTKTKNLENYFKAFKWLSMNGINLDDDEQFKGMLLFAHTIKSDVNLLNQYKQYISIIEKMAGKEDNLSITDLINILNSKSVSEALSQNNIENVRKQLKSLNKERIKTVFGKSFNTKERDIKRLFFFSSTYSLSGEIFSRLVDIDWTNSKRPFPKALDVPAVFGNKTAENILLNEYNENKTWNEYTAKLTNLQKQFKNFNEWNSNYGFKGTQTALSSFAEEKNYPDFMKTDAYNRKELSTCLASWTHIKHDLILYQEEPNAAECGQGGGPQPPKHYSYVEPNLKFWDTAFDLVNWLKQLSKCDSSFNNELEEISSIGNLLKSVAYKQVEGKEITDDEYEELHYIGGTIEYIYLRLLETDHIPEREYSMAIIANVYDYNGTKLNVAVGNADEIYVVVPIKGEYYIARGSVFSFYEFTGKIFTDEEWRADLEKGNIPPRPEWLNPLIKKAKSIESRFTFRY